MKDRLEAPAEGFDTSRGVAQSREPVSDSASAQPAPGPSTPIVHLRHNLPFSILIKWKSSRAALLNIFHAETYELEILKKSPLGTTSEPPFLSTSGWEGLPTQPLAFPPPGRTSSARRAPLLMPGATDSE